jgi:hypothetical protein
MALRFNTFRAKRYLRSKFVEGKYLLASEASDLELEILDVLRQVVKDTVGDVALADAWKVERLSSTQLLIKPGEAWFKGLPFQFRSGKDHLVSGAVLSLGVAPVGVTISDDATGLGKVVLFNDSALTPTNNYRVVVSAREELLTEIEDPFLQNANLTESTAQKIRLNFQINFVPESLQTESPIPYRDESSTSLVATNFPIAGAFASPNLVNQIVVTPVALGNGELINLQLITGSEKIDGRDVEITLRNDSSIGGGHPIPKSPTEQVAFENGKLIDSNGNKYHVNAIFNDVVSTQVVIRLDKEPDQPNPEIVNTKPFTLIKRDVYATDGINGQPQGKLFWPIATADWNSSQEFTHDSKVVDLRSVTQSLQEFEEDVNKKIDLIPTGGGNITFASDVMSWTSVFKIMSAYGPLQTISIGSAALSDGASLVYEMNLPSGGIISRGNLALTVLSSGSTITMNGLDDLSDIRLGNLLKLGSEIVKITSINNVSKQMQVSPALVGTGACTVYLDAFGSQSAPFSTNSFVLAIREGTKVWVGGGALELESGETNQLGDGITSAILTYLGATDELDSTPNYSSTNVITQGDPLPDAISDLDLQIGNINNVLSAPLYDERILYPAGLPTLTNITIPNNSRDSGNPHYYNVGSGDMMIFLNQVLKFVGIDYVEVDNQTIKFNYALNNDSEVHFRDADIGGFSAGGGSETLQDAYNLGRTITTTTGNPVEISGPSGEKLFKVNGDIEVTGVIDPLALQLTPTGSNPLDPGQRGIWVNLSDELIYEDGVTAKNLTQAIENLESGSGVSALTRLMFNGTASTIPKGTPVYSPSAGQIAPARGTVNAEARVIGIAAQNIAPSTNGNVAISGTLTGVSGYTHGAYLYLGDDPGEAVDVEPTLGPYPSGFNVVILGVVENNNIILQLHHVGVL